MGLGCTLSRASRGSTPLVGVRILSGLHSPVWGSPAVWGTLLVFNAVIMAALSESVYWACWVEYLIGKVLSFFSIFHRVYRPCDHIDHGLCNFWQESASNGICNQTLFFLVLYFHTGLKLAKRKKHDLVTSNRSLSCQKSQSAWPTWSLYLLSGS